jgi:hypothetical protein
MAPASRRRKLPTLIDRGLGLLEVVLPVGSVDSLISTLPDGQRDPGGFWFPLGYDQPGDIFTAQQRRLQAKQRQVQARRLGSRARHTVVVSGSRGAAAADTSPSRPHAPPQGRMEATAGDASGTEMPLVDRSLPLPSPSLEADPGPERPGFRTSRAGTFHNARPPLPDDSGLQAQAVRGVVDSSKGSD